MDPPTVTNSAIVVDRKRGTEVVAWRYGEWSVVESTSTFSVIRKGKSERAWFRVLRGSQVTVEQARVIAQRLCDWVNGKGEQPWRKRLVRMGRFVAQSPRHYSIEACGPAWFEGEIVNDSEREFLLDVITAGVQPTWLQISEEVDVS